MAFANPSRLEDTVRVVRNSGAMNAGLMVDCLHVYRCGATPAQYLDVDASLLHELQLCDAAAGAPVGREALIHEARFARLPPGEGALDLDSLWKVVPRDVWVSIEAPFGDARGKLPFAERARLLKSAADTFVARVGEPGAARRA
jgi:sugar phosphate isomerase/epimerase